jgi:hypothetical protein
MVEILMTRILSTEQPEGLTLKAYLYPIDTGVPGVEDGYELTETAARLYQLTITDPEIYGRYRVAIEMVSDDITATIDSGYVLIGNVAGNYILQNKLPELTITTPTLPPEVAYSSYGPKRVKTKEMEIEQFSPMELQKVQERANAALPSFCSGGATCVGRYKHERNCQ